MLKPERINWPQNAGKIKMKYLSNGFKSLGIPLKPSVRLSDEVIESQIYPFELVYEGKTVKVLFDITSATDKIHPELIGDGNFYFKVHMKREHIGKFPRFYPMAQSAGNAKFMKVLREIRRKRHDNRHDIMAVFANSDNGLRSKTVELIREQRRWKSLCWVYPRYERYLPPKAFQGSKLSYREHLRLQAESKLCVALPGGVRNSWLTFRHIEIWALGRCCLTVNPTNRIVLGDPKDCWVEFKEDLSDFVRIVDYYLEHDRERERIARNGRAYFNEYLTPRAHAEYILDTVEKEAF